MTSKEQIIEALSTTIFGNFIYHFSEIDSTNTFAVKLAREGVPEGTIVVSNFQTGGRGRLGKSWIAEAGKNLLLSLVLRPQLSVENVQKLTLAAADIILHSLEKLLIMEDIQAPAFSVKWPNDILLGGKKICGILSESALKSKDVEYIVIGIGINVNQEISRLPEEIRPFTTSLLAETGRTFDITEIIARLLKEFEVKYYELERSSYASVIRDWKEHCQEFGSGIIIETALGHEEAIFEDVNDAGVLIYRDANQQRKELVAGSIKRK